MSAAKKLSYRDQLIQEEINRQIKRKQRKQKYNTHKKRKEKQLTTMKMLCATTMIVLYSLFIIYLQSNILVTQKHITELKLQIEELSSSIKVRKSNLHSDPNIKEIYQQAVALGMVDPKEAQIIYYHPREVDYMNVQVN